SPVAPRGRSQRSPGGEPAGGHACWQRGPRHRPHPDPRRRVRARDRPRSIPGRGRRLTRAPPSDLRGASQRRDVRQPYAHLLAVARREGGEGADELVVRPILSGDDVHVAEALAQMDLEPARDVPEGWKGRVGRAGVDHARRAVAARRQAGTDALREGQVARRDRPSRLNGTSCDRRGAGGARAAWNSVGVVSPCPWSRRLVLIRTALMAFRRLIAGWLTLGVVAFASPSPGTGLPVDASRQHLGCPVAGDAIASEACGRQELGGPREAQRVAIISQSSHLDWDWRHTFEEYFQGPLVDPVLLLLPGTVDSILSDAVGLLVRFHGSKAHYYYSVAEMGYLARFVEAHPEML